MKAHIQFYLLKLTAPRAVQALLIISLILALALLSHNSVVYANPAGCGGGCGGG